jgi:hypothetical protein
MAILKYWAASVHFVGPKIESNNAEDQEEVNLS